MSTRAKSTPHSDDYAGRRDREGVRSRQTSESGRDIGPLPKVSNPRRRKRCEASLRAFLKTYFPLTFRLAWSADQLKLIERIERCVRDGGLFCLALPRGAGKTSIAIRAAIWALLTGRRRFVVLIGATERLAEKIIQALRNELQFNGLLGDDFPEVCYPIRKLENITKRQAGQTLDGEPTLVKLAAEEIVLPTVAGSKSSGAIVRAVGLTGAVRGQMVTLPGGETIRPDLVIPDDPQTRESAKSVTQTDDRELLVNGDVLGLAGPGQAIACVMPCTVIYRGDLSDRYLDAEKNPTWNGQRGKMLYALPTRLDLWDQYAELRRESFRRHADNRDGTAFYRQHRAEMDAGAEPSWPARFEPGELSAVQNAMNIRIDKPRAFASEYQNEPLVDVAVGVTELGAAAIAGRLTHVARGLVPRECTRLTAMVDVGKKLMWYCVCAWDERFGGSVIDYGTYPQQNRTHFAADDARQTLQELYPGIAEEAQVFAGLRDTLAQVLGREYARDGADEKLRVERCLVDSGHWPDAVFRACRQSPHAASITPSKGYGITAARKPMDSWQKAAGVRVGPGWRSGFGTGGSRGRAVLFDTNHWKSFAAQRLTTPAGAGALQLFGAEPYAHDLFAQHLVAESATATEGHGRKLQEWKVKPGRPDNHWWDCLVGATVAASVAGLVWSSDPAAAGPGVPGQPKKKKKRSMSDEYAKKWGGS